MATKIEWTDETWNPIRARRRDTGHVGWHCERVSEACRHCYAATFNGRMLPNGGTGLDYTRTKRDQVETYVDDDVLRKPLSWKRPRRVFPCSMTDLFGEWVSDEQIDRVFAVMNACAITLPASDASTRWHTFQVLTKRADRMQDYMRSRRFENWNRGSHPVFLAGRGDGGALRGCGPDVMNAGACLSWPPPNVWLGVTAENQQAADERIPLLLKTPAAVRFVSIEPLLGPVNLIRWLTPFHGRGVRHAGIDWVIVGGESGPRARPMHPDWARSLRDECQAAGVPFFFKQWGEWAPIERHHVMVPGGNYAHLPSGEMVLDTDPRRRHIWPARQIDNEDSFSALRVGKKAAGRLLDGREWNEYPEVAHA